MLDHYSSSTGARHGLAEPRPGRVNRPGWFTDALSLVIALSVLAASGVTLVLTDAPLPFALTYVASLSAGFGAYVIARKVLVRRLKSDSAAKK